MSTIFLSIQATYKALDIALFSKNTLLDCIFDSKTNTSSCIIQHLQGILANNKLHLNNLVFIAINNGPGAFISLRVAIATVNGIHAAIGIPLVGINGLQALTKDVVLNFKEKRVSFTIVYRIFITLAGSK